MAAMDDYVVQEVPDDDDMEAKAALTAKWEAQADLVTHVYEEHPETPASKAFKDAAAKKVRADSKKLHFPTRGDELEPLAKDMSADETRWRLLELGNNDPYPDVNLIYAFTGDMYFFSTDHLSLGEVGALARARELVPAIAEAVRSTAETTGNPSGTAILMKVAGGISQDEFDASMAKMAEDEAYSDIKSVVAFTGYTYYYSDRHISDEDAAEKARAEELRVKILLEVRSDSKYDTKLTNIATLDKIAPDTRPGEIDARIEDILQIPACKDIIVKTTDSGERFAFSTLFMTEEYAGLLLRTESKNPAYVIAETVREESRVYPRATNAEIFKFSIFGLDRNHAEEDLARTLELYEDIKIVPGTGDDTYLYSDLYLSEGAAETSARNQRHGDS
jgi:hypothetical protein